MSSAHFFFHSFIATVSYSLQTNFNSVTIFFSCFFVFNKFPALYAFHMYVDKMDMIKQSESLQTRYNMAYIYDRFYIRTHVYVFLFSVQKRVFELSRVWPWRWPREGTPYIVFIGPVFHNTIKTRLKRVGQGGYEWVEKEISPEARIIKKHANFLYSRNAYSVLVYVSHEDLIVDFTWSIIHVK